MASWTRRDFLTGCGQGVMGTILASTTSRGASEPHSDARRVGEDQSASGPPTGTITNHIDQPLANTTFLIYDVSSTNLLAETTTDASGNYSFSQSFGETLLVITNGEWFDTQRVTSFSGSVDISLRHQILDGPKTAYSGPNEPLGTYTIWRSFYEGHPFLQDIHVEIANTNIQEEKPNYKIGSGAYDLESGAFTASFPEDDILIDYGTQDSIDLPKQPSVSIVHTPNEVDSLLSTFHPLNSTTPALPLVSTSTFLTEWLRSSQVGEGDKTQQGLGLILGELPQLGKLSTLGDLLRFSYGDPLERKANVGDSSALRTNPNEDETVVLGWESSNGAPTYGEAAVSFTLPFKFKHPGATFQIGAEWEVPSWLGFGHGNGSYASTFELAPLLPPPLTGNSSPGDPDGDKLYEDVDGDGEITEEDVELLAENLESDAISGYVDAYDFNGNGKIDYGDVIELSKEID